MVMAYKYQQIARAFGGERVSVEMATDLRTAVGKLAANDQRILTLFASGYTAAEALQIAGVFANPERYIERLIRRVVVLLNGGDEA
jgi:hypothetical protein